MEPTGSIPYSQVAATCTYPEPARSSPYPHIQLHEDQEARPIQAPKFPSTKSHVPFFFA